MNKAAALVLVVTAVGLGSCQRVDPLAVVDNPSKTLNFIDAAAGDSTRIICVSPGKNFCTRGNADVIVTDVSRFEDFEAGWSGDHEIVVTVRSGIVEKFERTAVDGSVQLKLGR